MQRALQLKHRPLPRYLAFLLASLIVYASVVSTVHLIHSDTSMMLPAGIMVLGALLVLLLALRQQTAMWCYWALSTASLAPSAIGNMWLPLALLLLLPFLVFAAAGWQNVLNLVFLLATLWYETKDATLLQASIYILLIISFTYVLPLALRLARETAEARLESLRQQQLLQAQIQEELAQELHDVIAREISTIIIKAAGSSTQNTQSTLQDCERHARLALDELRRLVGTLRTQKDIGNQPLLSSAEADPESSFADAVELLSEEGFIVDSRVTGDLSALPPGIAPTFVKIIDELSFNTLKYAPAGETVILHVALENGMCELSTRNRYTVEKFTGTGHGLLSIQERVITLGGTIEYGRKGDCWNVDIKIPLEKR